MNQWSVKVGRLWAVILKRHGDTQHMGSHGNGGNGATVVEKPFIITMQDAVTAHNNDCEKASCLFRLEDEKI